MFIVTLFYFTSCYRVLSWVLPAVPGLGVQLGPCVRYPGQAQFQPLQYLAGPAKVELAPDAAAPPRERRSGAVAHGVGALIIKRKSFFWYPKTSFPRRRE